MKLAIIGATGLVGGKMTEVLEEFNFPVEEFIPVGSPASIGKRVKYAGKEHIVQDIRHALEKRPDIVLFSAGAEVSGKWARTFANAGAFVIDNSSAWRMDPDVKLIVPEVNIRTLTKKDRLIANPNCSTIQMVVALNPILRNFGISRIVVSTYQSVSGSGMKGIHQLESERSGRQNGNTYPHRIDLNCLPHCDVFMDNGYTGEEMKLINETRKIFNNDSIHISATAVRVPVTGGHSESIYIETEREAGLPDIHRVLNQAPGVVLQDNLEKAEYPMPYYSKDRNEVFVGRIRKDLFNPKALKMWVVADNLRKGAALNAVQIAVYVMKEFLIEKEVMA
ncbi:MAG: aspartate-semialdehyde dehydrogenase [Bacteroidota bacterium]